MAERGKERNFMDWLLQLDGNILLWIQEHIRKEFLNPIVIFISNLGNAGWFWLVLLALLVCIPMYRKTGMTGLIAVLIGFIITNVFVKNLAARIRPYEVVEGLRFIGTKPHDFSFPSGHSTCSVAASAVLLAKLPKKAGIPLFVLGILICLSRLYVGVHYPTDVLAGAAIGLFAAFAALYLMKNKTGTNRQKGTAA